MAQVLVLQLDQPRNLVGDGLSPSLLPGLRQGQPSDGRVAERQTRQRTTVGRAGPAESIQIARRATAPGETIHNEPFEVTLDMTADAIRAADAVAQAWKK